MQLRSAGIAAASRIPYSTLVETWLRDMRSQIDWAQALSARLEELGLARLCLGR